MNGFSDAEVEQLARASHELYLGQQTESGSVAGLRDWSELDEGLREANRDQVRDIAAKLAQIGCTVGPQTDSPFVFTDAELDVLARQEQIRWTRQRIAAGWVYGPVRDDAARTHPSLVSWDELSDAEREKDREVVRNIPAILRAAEMAVVRPAHAGDPSHGRPDPAGR